MRGRVATRGAAALLAAWAAWAAGCTWKSEGAAGALPADALAVDGAGPPLPSPGMALGDVLALLRTGEPGGMDVDVRELRLARVRGGLWEAISAREAVRDPAGEIAILSVRRCRDWVGRERWRATRSSWFILRDDALEAFDHWRFGPRCALGNAFAPAPPELLETERTLRRFLEQRHPPAPPPLAIRFQRGLAYLGAGRRAEARAELAAGDQALAARQDLYEERESTSEEQEAFAAESAALRRLRDTLAAAIAQAERNEGANPF